MNNTIKNLGSAVIGGALVFGAFSLTPLTEGATFTKVSGTEVKITQTTTSDTVVDIDRIKRQRDATFEQCQSALADFDKTLNEASKVGVEPTLEATTP